MLTTRAEHVVSAAAAAIGRPLADPVVLSEEADWAVVLRCADARSGETVVVKGYPATPAGRGCFAAEVAGLKLVGAAGLGRVDADAQTPRVLAAAPDTLTVVMSDLGTGPSLADMLLGDSAEAAATAMLEWAAASGRLSVANRGREVEFDEIRARYLAGQADLRHITGLPARVLRAPERAARLGVAAPAGLATEVAEIAAAAVSGGPAVFSPGDICPDNNLLTGHGIQFFDFEEAGFHSAFLDAAYIRMPFATCWCVFRLPGWLADAAEQAYRAQVSSAWPDLGDDDRWRSGIRHAAAAWTLSATSWLLDRSLEGNEPLHSARPSPRTRVLMRYRWASLVDELERSGELPAIAELMRRLLAATTGWQAGELPVYPAFRPR